MVKRFSTSNDPLEDPTRPQLLLASEGFDQLLPAFEGFDIDPLKACQPSSPEDHQANPETLGNHGGCRGNQGENLSCFFIHQIKLKQLEPHRYLDPQKCQ